MNIVASIISGSQFFWQGLGRLSEANLRKFVWVPLLANIIVLASFAWWAYSTLHYWLGELVEWLPNWLSWIYWLILPMAVLTLVMMCAYSFSVILMAILAPFNGLLSEQVDRLSNQPPPEEFMGRMVWRTLGREWTKIAYWLPRFLILLLLSIIPGVNFIMPILWLWFGAWMMALQYIDYSFDNHQRSFKETQQAFQSMKWDVLGFGVTVYVLMMVPIVNWFVMPAAVVGGTIFRQKKFPFFGR